MSRYRLSVFLVVVAAFTGSARVHAQSNDNFANRLTLTGPAPVAVSNNRFATRETGEPNHAGAAAGRSLWYTWTAPTTGVVNLGTFYSGNGAPTIRAVAVYTGGSLASLSEVASSNNQAQSVYTAGSYSSSLLAAGTSINVPVTTGTVYQIAVDAVAAPTAVEDDGTVVLAINAPPTILSAASVTGTTGASFAYAIAATGGATAYSASNLPAGLSLNPASGQITGVVGTAGTYTIALSATGPGGSGNATLTLYVNDAASAAAPAVYSAASARGFLNQTFTYSILATANPVLFSATNLPAGLTCNAQTGVISGSPTTAGTFTVPITVSTAGNTGTATLTFFIVAAPVPPVVTSALATSGTVGSPFALNVTTNVDPANGDQYAYVEATNLPDGLKIASTSNQPLAQTTLISGTPTKAGVFAVPLTVSSNGGTRQATLTITIVDPGTAVATARPELTSAATALGSVKTAFSYQLTATNPPVAFSASNLPPGLVLNSKTNTLSGTPTTPGTFLVPVSATNSVGNSTGTLTVTIAASDAALASSDGYALPVITSPASAVVYTGQSASYAILANYQGVGASPNAPWTFAASGLPPGMSLTGASSSYGTGYVSGTPTTTGMYQATVSATYPASANNSGSATTHPAVTSTAVVTFIVNAGPAPLLPVVQSAATAALTVGSAATYQVSAANGPVTYTVNNLPPGLSMNASGAVSGTPTTAGTYPATVSATNAVGTASATVTFYVAAGPLPDFGSSATAQATVGTAVSYSLTAQNGGSPYTASNLPPGLSLDASTGYISGTPTAAGVYNVPISATNANGATHANLIYTVLSPVASPPVIGLSLVTHLTVGSYGVYALYNDGAATGSTASGLPPGMTFDPSTGYISGTPTTVGTYTLPVSATNANGTRRATLTFVVANPPVPQIIETAWWNLTTGVNYSSSVLVLNTPTRVTITGLPPGLSYTFSPPGAGSYVAGTLSGTPTTPGTYRAAVTASNAGGSVSGTLTLVVGAASSAPAFQAGTAEERILPAGTSFSDTFPTSPAATSYAASGLPSGLSINTATGSVSGTPTTPGTYSVTVTATNAVGPVSLITVYVVTPAVTTLPSFDGPVTASGYAGIALPGVTTAASGNVAATYSATGLPAGLTIDPATGVITGTATTIGQYSANLTVTNPAGTGTAVLTILISDPASSVLPVFNYAAAEDDCLVGSTPSLGISASAKNHDTVVSTPLTITVGGLPPGMMASPVTNGVSIQGAPTVAGDYTVTATATVSVSGASARESILLRVLNPARPIITGEAGESGNVHLAFSSQIYASPSITGYAATGLPPGLSLNPASGTITGTPTAADTYAANVTVTGTTGTCSGVVTFRIDPPIYGGMPFITSAAAVGSQEFPSDQSATYALYAQPTTAIRYAINAYNQPTSYTASGLPPGLTLNPATGVISGTPGVTGTFQVPLTATNAVGTAHAVLTIISTTPSPFPQVALARNAYVGTACTVSAPAAFPANTPTSASYAPPSTYLPYTPPAVNYTATGLPPGLTINSANGSISGVPTAAGIYPVTITTADRTGSGSGIVTISVVATAPPIMTPVLLNSATTVGFVGMPIGLALSAPGATGFSATGLPSGLTFDPATGVFTGTLNTVGTFPVTVSASNSAGTSSATLTFDVETAPVAPILTSPAALTATIGRPFTGAVTVSTASLAPVAANYAAMNLPGGLVLDPVTGLLSGTPTAAAGSYSVPINVSVGQSPVPCGVLTLTLQGTSAGGAPTLTSPAGALGLVNTLFVYTPVDPDFAPVAGSLPTWLTYDAARRVISGYPTGAADFLISFQTMNAGQTDTGSGPSATLTVKVLAPDDSLPRITAQPVGGTAMEAGNFTFTAVASGAPPPSFQWYRDGLAISGATNSALTLTGVQPTDSGGYTVVATNAAGSMTSSIATLLVLTTYHQWQTDHFTAQEIAAGLAGDHVSFSGDGVSNLLKYALDLDPRANAGGAALATVSRSVTDGTLTISFMRDAARTDIDYVVEASPDLNVWMKIAESDLGAAIVNLDAASAVETKGAGTSQNQVTVKTLPAPNGAEFLRVRIVRP